MVLVSTSALRLPWNDSEACQPLNPAIMNGSCTAITVTTATATTPAAPVQSRDRRVSRVRSDVDPLASESGTMARVSTKMANGSTNKPG